MFELICFFGGFDERLKFINNFSMDIKLYNSDLNRLILGKIQSCRLKIQSDISVIFIEHHKKNNKKIA
jgi:hypothetical protein